MKKYIFLGLLLFTALLIHGQNLPVPGSSNDTRDRPATVSEARNLPHDSPVIMTGYIINRLPGGRFYTFRDSTGEIPVEIGPRRLRGLSVNASEQVEIRGRVNVQRRQFSIDVNNIRKF